MEYLILAGSNLNNPPERLAEAVRRCSEAGLPPVRSSALYFSLPLGFESPHIFFNQAHVVDSGLAPPEVLNILLQIELEMGRHRLRQAGYQDRTIDLDILMLPEKTFRNAHLEIPHPRLHLRRFALVPAAELAPHWRHPVLNRTLAELLQQCPDQGPVKPWQAFKPSGLPPSF